MTYILAVIGAVWALSFVLRLLFGERESESVVVYVAPRQDDDSKDKRNLGGGLGL